MNESTPSMPETPEPVPPTPPSTPPSKPKSSKMMIIAAAVVGAIVIVGGVAFGLGWLHMPAQKAALQEDQFKGVTIPELGVKIADPDNRGLNIFYDDSDKAQCEANKNYLVQNACDNYLKSDTGHCKDANLNDGFSCGYYLYDNTTYDASAATSPTDTHADKYYKCGSDLTIYEITSDKKTADTDTTADVQVGDRTISLWAHTSHKDSGCDDATSSAATAAIKNLLQYVKANLSAQ